MALPTSPPPDVQAAAVPDARRFVLGALAALATVTIWAGWIAATRLAVTTELGPADVAMLRFGVAGLLLSPVLWREGLAWRRIGAVNSVVMTLGAGILFFLVATAGMAFAPAAQIGALLPGTMPVFVALFAAAVLGERLSVTRRAGFVLIFAGVVWVAWLGAGVLDGREWIGYGAFLTAAALWACFTVAMRRSGVGALHAAALVNGYSFVLLAPAYLLFSQIRLATAPLADVALQAVVQGGLSGVVALSTYGAAIRLIGASRAAAFSALTPVLVALFGIPILGEVPDALTMLAVVVVSLGVVLASGAVGERRAGRGVRGPSPHR